jgi:hypothetical protein
MELCVIITPPGGGGIAAQQEIGVHVCAYSSCGALVFACWYAHAKLAALLMRKRCVMPRSVQQSQI